MIDWEKGEYTEPPLLRDIGEDELLSCVLTPRDCQFLEIISKLPNHTQAVERCVKLVTEAAAVVTDTNRRDGVIRNTISSREIMPKFESKKDFHQ